MLENNVKDNQMECENEQDLNKEAFLKFKVILIGDCLVGKTTLTQYLAFDYYKPDAKRTIGVDFSSKNFLIDNEPISLNIWDFSGESRFRELLPKWILGASGCIFMYDITNIDSLFHINEWLKIIYKVAGLNIPIAISGGKSDLEEQRKITYELGKSIADFYGISIFYETSSVSGENVKKIFKELAKRIYYKTKVDDFRRNKVNQYKNFKTFKTFKTEEK